MNDERAYFVLWVEVADDRTKVRAYGHRSRWKHRQWDEVAAMLNRMVCEGVAERIDLIDE